MSALTKFQSILRNLFYQEPSTKLQISVQRNFQASIYSFYSLPSKNHFI